MISVFDSFSIPVAAGVVLRADRSFATARSRGQPRCPSSRSRVPAPLPQAAGLLPVLHSLSQLYSLLGLQPCTAACPRSVPAAQGPGPAPSGEPQVPAHRGARKARPEPETSAIAPGQLLPHPEYWPLGPSTDSSASTSCSLSQSRPQPQKAHSMGPFLSSCCPACRLQQPQKEDPKILTLAEYRLHGTGSLPPLGSWRSSLSRARAWSGGGAGQHGFQAQ